MCKPSNWCKIQLLSLEVDVCDSGNTLTQDMEEKILSMYAKGMTTGDIESHMKELYGMDISDSTISRITDKIPLVVREWQGRPLEEVYVAVFMDAIHYYVAVRAA